MRRGKIQQLAVMLAALAALVIVAGPAGAGKKENILNFAWSKELETLDRYYNTAREGLIVSRLAYDDLIYRNPDTWEYEPLLATSWKWVDDVTIELELRQGVTFHDGSDFTSADVVASYERILNEETGSAAGLGLSFRRRSATHQGRKRVTVQPSPGILLTRRLPPR